MGNPRKVTVGITYEDYYRFYRRDNSTVTQSLYSKILNDYFKLLKEELFEKRMIQLPQKFGRIKIVKYQPELDFDKDGKLINKLPINLKATYDLWEKDAEAKAKKVLVRFRNLHTQGYVYRILWNKGLVPNIGLLTYKPNRILKRELSHKIQTENYDTFIS